MDRDSYLMARISARRSKQFSDAMHGFAKAVERMMAKAQNRKRADKEPTCWGE